MSATSPAVTTRRTANQAPVRCKSKVRADGENGRPWTRRKTPRWVLRIAGKLLWLPHRAATAPWLTLRSGARVSGGRRWARSQWRGCQLRAQYGREEGRARSARGAELEGRPLSRSPGDGAAGEAGARACGRVLTHPLGAHRFADGRVRAGGRLRANPRGYVLVAPRALGRPSRVIGNTQHSGRDGWGPRLSMTWHAVCCQGQGFRSEQADSVKGFCDVPRRSPNAVRCGS